MSWMMAGMAALSIAGSAAQNKKSKEGLKQNVDGLIESYEGQIAQLQELAKSKQSDIRLEMTANRYNGLKNTSSTTAQLAERELAGNTSARIYDNTDIMKMMSHNALAKKAEETAVNFGVEMENKRVDVNNAIRGAQTQAASTSVSPIQATTSAVSAGFQGYQLGQSGLSSSSLNSDSIAETSKGSIWNSYNGTIRK